MRLTLLLASFRFYLRHPWQASLAIIGIALGVAVFVGVDVANTSAQQAFDRSADFVRGATTHRLLPALADLDESVYRDLIAGNGFTGAPIVETNVSLSDGTGRRISLLGVDPFEEAGFRDATRVAIGSADSMLDLISTPSAALVPVSLLGDDPVLPRDLRLRTETGEAVLQVIGVLPSNVGAEATIVADISTAQELAGMLGRISRIDLMLNEAEATWLATQLPEGTVLIDAGNENRTFTELSNAFRTNIIALGLLALAVGMFMVYSTMSFSILQRSRMFAVLRAMGTHPHELTYSIFIEVLIFGTAGALLGVALGYALARLLVDLMLLTVEDFAFRNAVGISGLSPWLLVKGAALGIFATCLAAIEPIRRATRIDPAAAMSRTIIERSSLARTRGSSIAAVVVLLIGLVLLAVPGGNLVVAFTGLFCILAAAALVTPAVSFWFVRLLEPLLKLASPQLGSLAARNVLAQRSRIAVASSALSLAVATVIGVGIMVGSFRSSLSDWLDSTLTSDLYLNLGTPTEDSAIIDRLTADNRVSGLSQTRFVDMATEYGNVALRAFVPGPRGWGLQIIDAETAMPEDQLATGDFVAISEPFAYRNNIRAGERVSLPTEAGSRNFEVAAIYRDYNTAGAGILMHLGTYRQYWTDHAIDGIGIELHDAAATESFTQYLRDSLATSNVRISSTIGIKAISMRIFDRTFRITEVLRLLAGIVAFLGILSALMAVQLERQHEFAILRSLGFAPKTLAALIITETGVVGFVAGLVAIPIGIALSGLLIFIINVRSFGWTMNMIVQPSPLILGLLMATLAALLAGVIPSMRSYRSDLSAALHHE